jgi:hypothetical protein
LLPLAGAMRGGTTAWALLGVAALALLLRLGDPLGSPVLPNEDPYLMLYRAERLDAKGLWPDDYTKGFPAMLVAWKAFGVPMYDAARLLPAFWGAAGVVLMHAVARRLAGDAAGLGAAFLFAVIPEVVKRSNFLAPTALDMALLPLLAWCAVDLASARLRALPLAAVVAVWLAFAHPWGLLYVGMALAPWMLHLALRPPAPVRWVRPLTAGALGLGIPAGLWLMQGPDTGLSPIEDVAAHVGSWLTAPTFAYHAPKNVNLVGMLGPGAIALAIVGAMRGPARLRNLGLGWVAMLLPVAALTLTSVPFAAERTVAFLAPGVALLGGAATARFWYAATRMRAPSPDQWASIVAALLVLASVTAVPAASAKGWWRIYQPEEQDLYMEIAEVDEAIVVTGSWQAAVGIGAWGGDTRPLTAVFKSEKVRAKVLAEAEAEGRPLLVVIDRHTRNKADPEHAGFRNYTYDFVHVHGDRLDSAGSVKVFQYLPLEGPTAQPRVVLGLPGPERPAP